ncbi:hypothetical protein JG688_00013124 [Phytophthora aleatoria]|nr:hypothetical protein JG688_00013124 [Phytophthora aleatoria]
MAQLFVSADVMGISSREVIGFRSMQREFRKGLERKLLHWPSFFIRLISIVNYL